MIHGETVKDESVASLEQQKAVLAEIMFVDVAGKLQYFPEIAADQSVQNIHSPLSELMYIFYSDWAGIAPPNPQSIRKEWVEPKYQKSGVAGRQGVYVVDNFSSGPSGLFASLEILRREQAEFARNVAIFEKSLSKMKEILLLGAISPTTVYSTAVYLEDKGFSGNLVATDLSPVPLNIAKKLNARFPFTKKISLEMIAADATTNLNDQLGEKRFGLVISDILGYYLSAKQYNWSTTNVDSLTTIGGYYLTRELTEPNVKETGFGQNVNVSASTNQEFLFFLKKYFPSANYTAEDIANFLATRWPTDTVRRKDSMEYLGENNMNSKLSAHVVTAPSLESLRVFETFLFKKRRVRFFN
jgi:hypothetical protein